MAYSSIRHAKTDGTTMFSVLSLNILQSIDSQKVDALASIGIKTIADLLHYKYIYQAQILVNYANGLISHDFELNIYLDNGLQNTPLEDIPNLPLSALKGIGPTLETTWETEFNIKNLQELSEFAPYLEAIKYLTPDDEVFNEPASAPEDLMPKILGGIHSSVKFNSFVLHEDLNIPGNLQWSKGNGIGFLDTAIANIFIQKDTTRLSIGYIAAFKQNWINKGTHLGEIIHTLALAPGESRNMSSIEWYRRQSSSRDESTMVDEQLSSSLVHSRALNEVTKATAREHQEGSTIMSSNNSTTSESKTSGFGGSLGAGATVPIKGVDVDVDLGLSGSMGKSKVSSDSSQQGVVISSSSGSRDIMGSVMQNINDSTIQNSSNARSMYSTVVVSDVQQESEQTSTRNVTNYNHMHSLNIVSYEVVQNYGIETKMVDYNTILYVSFRPIIFDINVIKQYWYIFKYYLLAEDPILFERFDTFINGGVIRDGFSSNEDDVTVEAVFVQTNIRAFPKYKHGSLGIGGIRSISIIDNVRTIFENSSNGIFKNFRTENGTKVFGGFNLADLDKINLVIQNVPPRTDNPNGSINISYNLNFKIKDNSTNDITTLTKFYDKLIKYHKVEEERSNDGTSTFSITTNVKQDILDAINEGPTIDDVEMINELEEYFNRKKYYFTRLVLNNIENEVLTDVFRNLTLGNAPSNRPFTDYVNPIPIGITDNYLILETKNNCSGTIGNQIKEMIKTEVNKGLELKIKDEVFLPTAGVFAEAILGRANGSEFIDLRRFWNWQDSPIPNSAPTINPINTGSRDGGIPDNLDPNTPVGTLNIINPAPFQNPTSLDSALAAVQNGNMFRDMSKSEQLAGAMQNLSELAKETAKQAATLSGDARKEALAAAVKMGQQVAETVDQESKSKDKPKTPTEKGGALNELDKLDGNKDEQKEDVLGLNNTPFLGSELSANANNDFDGDLVKKFIGYPSHSNGHGYPLADLSGGNGNVNLSWINGDNRISSRGIGTGNIFETSTSKISINDNTFYLGYKKIYFKVYFESIGFGAGYYHYHKAIQSKERTINQFNLNSLQYSSPLSQFDFNPSTRIVTSDTIANLVPNIALAIYMSIIEDLRTNVPNGNNNIPVNEPTDITQPIGSGTTNGWLQSDIDSMTTEIECTISVNPADGVTLSELIKQLKSWGYNSSQIRTINIATNSSIANGTFTISSPIVYRVYTFNKLNLDHNF